jgi:formylglycine-generating enzyme required for sulfatase activity
MDYNPSFFENTSHYPNAPKHPVEQLSWYDAIEFCNQLSELQGLDKCYRITNISTKDTDGNEMNRIMYANVDWNTNANGYRLPIEKEWEYAAKAGTNNRYAGTDDENKLGEYAWYYNNSIALGVPTHPVATKKPNEWGFYDMTGNVYEWCWDKYDPIGYRAFRGGSFEDSHSNEKKLYITSCQKEEPNDRDKIVIGFRICRTF